MPDQLQLRGGTTAEHSTFTGAIKEVTVDTTKKTAVVHDGTTAGGIPLLRQDGNNSALALGSAGTPSLKWDANTGIYSPGEDQLAVATNGTPRLSIDASGRLLVGTSTARSNFFNATVAAQQQLEGTTLATSLSSVVRTDATAGPSYLVLAKSRGASIGANTIVQDADGLGGITFQGNDGTEFVEAARILAEVDGTPGANDMPGRLGFFTTANGASSPTERMRITAAGRIGFLCNPDGIFPAAVSASGANGSLVSTDGSLGITTNGVTCAYINRNNADGDLIRFYESGNQEGAISVSGTTVTYGGGHLARWSQLPNNEDPTDLLKGTVMSNLDEMCEWGEEDNEQLNKTKVSNVEGDKNVAGVFVSTSFSDDGPLDFFVGMTGDMIIRIAEGVTVERGDLLMSAGDGTAKPQDDDIIRSKTVAKVTSTNVSCTYEDGSYCVPCVLMAC